MATPEYVLMQIRSLEDQVRGLRSIVNGMTMKPKESKGIGDLHGIWKGKVHFSDEEIEQAKTAWMKPFPA